MQVSFKAFLYVAIALIVVLFAVGAIAYKKPAYGCYPESASQYTWGKKVEVFNIGNVHFYATPLVKDCEEEYRYDPSKVEKCFGYCGTHLDSIESNQ